MGKMLFFLFLMGNGTQDDMQAMLLCHHIVNCRLFLFCCSGKKLRSICFLLFFFFSSNV